MKLSQIVVDEVSLVDKAANKRKFLLYKRDTSAESPAEILKQAESAIELLLGVIVPNDDKAGEGAREEMPPYAQQAKDLLSGKMLKAIGHFTKEEREALVLKITPPPSKDGKPPADDDEFTPEEEQLVQQLAEKVTSLQQEVTSLK